MLYSTWFLSLVDNDMMVKNLLVIHNKCSTCSLMHLHCGIELKHIE